MGAVVYAVRWLLANKHHGGHAPQSTRGGGRGNNGRVSVFGGPGGGDGYAVMQHDDDEDGYGDDIELPMSSGGGMLRDVVVGNKLR